MHPLEVQISHIINRDNLVPSGGVTIVGVSGGPDSVCLLVVLSRLQDVINTSPVSVYVDHGLRPGEIKAEKEYVAVLSGNLGVPFECVVVPTAEYAETNKLSLEHAARDLRYEALRKIMRKKSAARIATAHTADDQAEEILIRLLRGGGRKSISGMRTKNEDIIRPFLEIEKKDIVAYLAENNIRFLEDSSNTDRRFLRNRVRHELIPYLEEHYDPGVRKALRKTAENLAEDEKLLEELTGNALKLVLLKNEEEQDGPSGKIFLDRSALIQQPAALQRRVIEHIIWRIGVRASFSHIIQVIDAAREGRTGSEIHLSRGLRVGVQRNYLEFVLPEGKCAWRGKLYS